MGNPYIKPFQKGEFVTYQGMVDEIIESFGTDVYYLPRQYEKEDYLFGEDILSKFTKVYKMTMFLESAGGFEGSGDLFTKFGLNVQDELVLTIEKDRFKRYTSPDDVVENYEMEFPVIGDLLYIDWAQKSLFEISHSEDAEIFFHLGDWVVWKLTCTKFQYSHENIDLSSVNPDIDDALELASLNDDGLSDNDNIEEEFEDLRDFTEEDPFGE